MIENDPRFKDLLDEEAKSYGYTKFELLANAIEEFTRDNLYHHEVLRITHIQHNIVISAQRKYFNEKLDHSTEKYNIVNGLLEEYEKEIKYLRLELYLTR